MTCIPVRPGVCDLCENAQIVTMLLQCPDPSPGQVAMASLFTGVNQY